MVIVAGYVTVEPQVRDSYVAGCVRIVEQGRAAAGCLGLAVSADLTDPARVNIYERWESQGNLEAHRSHAPGPEHEAEMLTMSVAEYDIADVRSLFGDQAGS
ncbi:MAG: antibiotic biosynthesis monooxygenase [Pseudonocardiales bacterium]|nr:MAG: antibiotic biosynthesis monooxygenase [Pseudonocardiales bacterium]